MKPRGEGSNPGAKRAGTGPLTMRPEQVQQPQEASTFALPDKILADLRADMDEMKDKANEMEAETKRLRADMDEAKDEANEMEAEIQLLKARMDKIES